MIGIKVTKVARISRDVDRKNFVRLIKHHKKIAQTIMVIDAEKNMVRFYSWRFWSFYSFIRLASKITSQISFLTLFCIFFRSVTYATLLNSDLINDMNNALRNKCQISGDYFINNNITRKKLCKNGWHWTNSGKVIIKKYCAVFKK